MTTLIPQPQQPTDDLFNSEIRLKDILKTIPKEYFQQDRLQAWSQVFINIFLVIVGYIGLAIAPWFLLPLFWIFTGTALTGFFVIAHDCGHRSFAKRRWVNDLVGHTLLLPLIYPFHSWRILHNHHHLHTNKIGEDNAWQPFQPEFYASLGKLGQWGYQLMRGGFWWIASILHWGALHFNWTRFEGKQRQQVRFSALLVIAFAAIAFPLLFATTGVWGVIKFWFVPWLVYHFWMSTFTLVHHTAVDIPFYHPDEWNAARSQLSGTIHCNYPQWVEFLCHDISVLIPHHISTAIPSYKLWQAYRSLQLNWGAYLHPESNFSWTLMQQITSQCHLYNRDNCYQSCREYHRGTGGYGNQ
jgi:omega-6 fatty acid desaturase (delta-12 desaturase)